MITLDGSYGEGGGSLVRTALALSTLTGQEFTVTNIRSGREQPGLKAQHLTAITALQEICQAETNAITIGSSELWFKPGKIRSGTYPMDIGTAGSITLLLQSVLLPSLFAPGKITFTISGGTCGKWQASVDYLQHILLPQLRKFVKRIELQIIKRGYYPKGGGQIILEISPKIKTKDFTDQKKFFQELPQQVPAITLTSFDKWEQIRGIINLSKELQEKEVGERIKTAAEKTLQPSRLPTAIRIEYVDSRSVGGEVLLWAAGTTDGDVDVNNPLLLGSDVLIEKGKTSEHIGAEVAEKLLREINGGFPVDPHLADMLVPFLALRPGSALATREITPHALTNMHVVEQFLPVKFRYDQHTITVEPKENL